MSKEPDIYRMAIFENMVTVFASALCVGLVALGTESMHCLWGLLILLNLNTFKKTMTTKETRNANAD